MPDLKGVLVAKITRSFGLSGGVCLQALTDIKQRIYDSKEFYLNVDCTEKIIVEKIEGDWDHLHLFFKGYDNLNKTRNLIGKFLYLPKEDSLKLNDNELFYYELLMYKIEYSQGKKTFANDIYISNEIVYLSIIIDNKEYLVPFLSPFVEFIDKENKLIKLQRFDLIEGNNIGTKK